MPLVDPGTWTVKKPFAGRAVGSTITGAALAAIRNRSALASAGYIVPANDPYYRRVSVRAYVPTSVPTTLLAAVVKSTRSTKATKLTTAEPAPDPEQSS